MRGHEYLIELRKAGKRPASVFINDFHCKTDWPDWGDQATVCVDGDQLSSLDLRFVVGMVAHVSSTSEGRAKRIAEICKQSGARIVGAVHGIPQPGYLTKSGWSEIWFAPEKKE